MIISWTEFCIASFWQIPSDTLWHRRETSKKIKNQLEQKELIGEHRIYVNLPDPKAHSNHLSEQVKLIMRLCMIGKLFLSNMCISIRKSYVAAFLKIHFCSLFLYNYIPPLSKFLDTPGEYCSVCCDYTWLFLAPFKSVFGAYVVRPDPFLFTQMSLQPNGVMGTT